MKFIYLIAAALGAAALPVLAQVEVIDRTVPRNGTAPATSSPQPAPSYTTPAPTYTTTQDSIEQPTTSSNSGSGNAAEVYYQVQLLQQEVSELRGLVEEQAHQIKQLKQQRLDDYVDLDRRLSQVSGGAVSSSPSSNSDSASRDISSATSSAGGSLASDELASYKNAFNLVVREQNYDKAIVALEEHLQRYPNGQHAANAQYWLGEVYLAKNDLENAKRWFDRLLQDYPLSSKVPDAKYKLGTVYHMMGADVQARTLLEEVSRSQGNAAKLARNYLQDNL